MRNEEEFKGRRGGGRRHKEHGHHKGAKTFRRGRAIAFLDVMNTRRSTIKQQLEEPEFESIRQVLVGELKALDLVITEFVRMFEIHQDEMLEGNSEETGEEKEGSADEASE